MVRNRHHDVGMAGVRPAGMAPDAGTKRGPPTPDAMRCPIEEVGRIGSCGCLREMDRVEQSVRKPPDMTEREPSDRVVSIADTSRAAEKTAGARGCGTASLPRSP